MPLCWNGKWIGTQTELVTVYGNGLKIQSADLNPSIQNVPISSTRSDPHRVEEYTGNTE